jgi:hypothetical protein
MDLCRIDFLSQLDSGRMDLGRITHVKGNKQSIEFTRASLFPRNKCIYKKKAESLFAEWI